MSRIRLLPAVSSGLLVAAAVLPALAEIIPFDSGQWVLYDAEVVEHLGRPALMGSAFLPGAAFTDGVIAYDVAVDGTRGYPGVTFRANGPQEYESFYCRPHVPDRPDALQYTPVFGGVAGWQLYNGPGFTAAASIPTGEWIHVRLEIQGRRARVFFGDQTAPALVIEELKHEPRAGAVGIRSEHRPAAFFSNFAITRPGELDLGPPPDPPVPARGIVKRWELSPPLLATDLDLETCPDRATLDGWSWTDVAAEPGGLVDLARHVPRHRDGQADVVYARLIVEADRDERRPFSLGYSDVVRVFLDGQPLFAGNSAYRSRDETFSGIIGLEDTVYLPLHAGENELLVAVMESFGGWGLMGRDNAADQLAPGMVELWRHAGGQRLPESVLHDPDRGVLYVTQYFRGGNECISRLSTDGEILERDWVTSLVRPTGMALHGGSLWVVDRRALVRIDPDAGTIVERFEIPDAVFPNDVDFDAQGRGYVSDTEAHCILRLQDGVLVRWLDGDEIRRPNGILVDRDRLLFGNSGDGRLKAVDLNGEQVTVVARLGSGAIVDGIRPDGRGGILVSDFHGRLLRVAPNGAVGVVLDTTASGAHCADFEYVPATGLLVVPGLYDNRLTAYRVSVR